MTINLLCVGKTSQPFLIDAIQEYVERINRMIPLKLVIIPQPKNAAKLPPDKLKSAEADLILQRIKPDEPLFILDERGKQLSSTEFAEFFKKQTLSSSKSISLLIGGAFGFDQRIYARAHSMLSCSRMTFSHQLIRLILLEQIYRAFTIIKNIPYHHS